jgi:hypothetical protein
MKYANNLFQGLPKCTKIGIFGIKSKPSGNPGRAGASSTQIRNEHVIYLVMSYFYTYIEIR